MIIIFFGLLITFVLTYQDAQSGYVRVELLFLWGLISLNYVGGNPPIDTFVLFISFSFLAWKKKLGWGDVWFASFSGCWVPFAPYCIASGIVGCLLYSALPQIEQGRPFIPALTVALWLIWLAHASGLILL